MLLTNQSQYRPTNKNSLCVVVIYSVAKKNILEMTTNTHEFWENLFLYKPNIAHSNLNLACPNFPKSSTRRDVLFFNINYETKSFLKFTNNISVG